jgi:hypothetical protein
MARSRLALVLLLGSFVALYCLAVPAPVARPTSPAAFFPTALGTRWTYRLTERRRPDRPEKVFERIQVVSESTDSAGARVVTVIEHGDYDPYQVCEWSVSETQILQRSKRSGIPGPWSTMFRAPMTPGKRWMETNTEADSRVECTVACWELVRVPAGTYQALRVDIDQTMFIRRSRPETLTASIWYAPGIGHVKMVVTANAVKFLITEELTAFTPGTR